MRVPRHDFGTASADQAMAPVVESANEAVDGIETSEYDRADAVDMTLAAADWRCVKDPRVGALASWEAWVLAMQTGAALFAAGTAQEGPVECRVGTEGEVRKLPATGPQNYLHAGSWLTAFYLAVICREDDRINQLAQVPLEFLRASGMEFDDYVYDGIRALQLAWSGEPQTWDSLVAAIQGTAPENARIASNELMLKILYPPMELFQLYLRRGTASFNQSLVNALTWHKEYWTANKGRSLSATGLVALAPLGMACLAHDADMPIDVESEYLPHHLLRRTWVGEFPT
ncbi:MULTISPECIES: immunity 49 family protein [unclassified Kitasatospora]|uniref:immunity 49 family protein n=1 Tax=unclassified Kitasatospora TaxID=2633591 RepID=UPI002477116B|nr:immunity 49 family protein [Kitasatospora sp. MAP12-44]